MKKKADYSELWFLGVILVYVLYYANSLRGYNYKATLWPYILMIFVVVLVGIIGFDTIKQARAAKAAENRNEKEAKPSFKGFVKKYQKVIVMIAALFVYALLINWLGYVICNFLFAFFTSWYLGRNIKKALIVTVLVTASFWFAFDYLLDVHFPELYLPF